MLSRDKWRRRGQVRHERGAFGLMLLIWFAALFQDIAPATAKPAASTGTGFYIDFLARPTEYAVDHAFVQIGRTALDGRDLSSTTIAFFPAGYPDIRLTTPLFRTFGNIRSVPEDRPPNASARFRVWVDERVYGKALAHGAWMRRRWRHYDLITRNCNSVLFEYADRLGLNVPKWQIEGSSNLVRAMGDSNPPRLRRAWKERIPV